MKDPIWFKCLVRLAIISAVSAFTLAPRHAPFERHRHVGPLRSKPESENTFGEYGEDAIDPKLSSMVDDLITAAQTGERKSGGAITKEEIAEQAEQVAAMYSKASSEIKEEMQDGLAYLAAEMEAKRVADVDAATADLFSDIDSMTEELLRGKMERAAAKGPVSSGDKDADAALAAAEAKVAAARAARAARGGAGGGVATSTTCVVVTAGGSSSSPEASPGPVAVALAEQLKRDRGWTVLPLTLPLDGANPGAPATDENAAITAACSAGACVVVCPELPGNAAEGEGSTSGKKSGGFFGNLMKMKDQASSESLAPIDSRALAAAFKEGGALAGAQRVVLLSTCGTERAGVFPYSVRNTLGALDRRRSVEQAVVLYSKQQGADYTVVRVGDLVASPPSSTGAASDVTVAGGDVLDGATSPSVVAAALTQIVSRQDPVARNASLGLQGTTGAESLTDEAWDELFLPLDGPEVWRSVLPPSFEANQAHLWVRKWATMWTEKGSGLTTPVRVRDTATGVALFFDPKPTGYVSAREEKDAKDSASDGSGSKSSGSSSKSKAGREGGLEVAVDQAPTPANEVRVRVKRTGYADGVSVKEKSEEVILRRLKDDLSRWAKIRA